MKPPENTIAGNGFVMWSSVDRRRAPVVRALSQLMGPGSGHQGFAFRFADASQLPSYMSRRVDVTVAKFMYAVAESYVRGMSAPLLTVTVTRSRGITTFHPNAAAAAWAISVSVR